MLKKNSKSEVATVVASCEDDPRTAFQTFTTAWESVKSRPNDYIGVTKRLTLSADDLEAWIEATAIDVESWVIDGNREENKANRDDLVRHIPTLADFDADVSRLVICGVAKHEQTCLGDGGHRGRRLTRLLIEARDNLDCDPFQYAVVDVLFSDREPTMGGFDGCGRNRDTVDKLKLIQKNTDWAGWEQWQKSTGQLIRLRSAGKPAKGGGKDGDTWNKQILTKEQAGDQWLDGTFDDVNKLAFDNHGKTKKSLWTIYEAWQATKIPLGNGQCKIFGYFVVALLDLVANDTGVINWNDVDTIIDQLDKEAIHYGNVWKAYREITQPKAAAIEDYSAVMQILQAALSKQKIDEAIEPEQIKVDGVQKYFKLQSAS